MTRRGSLIPVRPGTGRSAAALGDGEADALEDADNDWLLLGDTDADGLVLADGETDALGLLPKVGTGSASAV